MKEVEIKKLTSPLIEKLIANLTKNVMDSTITTFIQEFIKEAETDTELLSKVIRTLHNHGWNGIEFGAPPNKQNIINALYDL